MRQGTYISGAAHIAFIGIALFGLPDFQKQVERQPIQFSDVSIISLSEFDAAQSTAPTLPENTEVAMQTPTEDLLETETPSTEDSPTIKPSEQPDAAPTDEAPDVTALTVPTPDVSVDVIEPQTSEDAPIGLDTPLPDAAPQDGSVNSNNTALLAPQTPNLAPRIDTTAAPKPPEPAEEAPEVTPEAAPEDTPEVTPEEPAKAAAPEEATTEITPEAEVQESPTTPKAASRPKGRPITLVADAERREKEAEAIAAALAAESEKEETPEEAPSEAKPTEQAAAPSNASASRLGQDFNSGQKQAIGDAVGQFWNKAPIEGKDNYPSLIVVVKVKLSASGKMIGNVEPVEPPNPTGDFKIAFRQARIAVIKATNVGLPLPADKFQDGDYLEIRFDPGRSAISLE